MLNIYYLIKDDPILATFNNAIVNVPSGSHTLELRAASSSTTVQLGGIPTIPSPDNSYSSASLTCYRIF